MLPGKEGLPDAIEAADRLTRKAKTMEVYGSN